MHKAMNAIGSLRGLLVWVQETVAPVWASFRGPEADDYEALPEEPLEEQGGQQGAAELTPARSRWRRMLSHRRYAGVFSG
jgi:hypothetical protein